MNRRDLFKRLFGGAVVAATLDVDKLLWLPGETKIFIPPVMPAKFRHTAIFNGRIESYFGTTEIVDDLIVPGKSHLMEGLPIGDPTTIQSMCLWSNKDVVLYAGKDMIPLKAKRLHIWARDLDAPCPFTGNVDDLYVSNTGAEQATVKVRVLQDP